MKGIPSSGQLPKLFGQLRGFSFQFGNVLGNTFCLLVRDFLHQAGLCLAENVKLIFGTVTELLYVSQYVENTCLKGVVQLLQLSQLGFIAEIQATQSLAHQKAVGIISNLAQAFNVTAIAGIPSSKTTYPPT